MTSIPADTLARASAAYRAAADHERGIAAAAHVVWDHVEARLWVHPRPELLRDVVAVCETAEHVRDIWRNNPRDEELSSAIDHMAAFADSLSSNYGDDLEAEIQAALAGLAKKAAEDERQAVVARLRKLDCPDAQIRVGALIMLIEQKENMK